MPLFAGRNTRDWEPPTADPADHAKTFEPLPMSLDINCYLCPWAELLPMS